MSAGRPFIYLATPCYGGLVEIRYLRSVLELQSACAARGVGLHVELSGGDAMITRTRARLAAQFLAHPQATHLLMCDADIGFTPQNAFRLLDSGKDLAGGVCPLKHIDWDKLRAAAKAGVDDLMAASVGYVVRFLPTPDKSVEVEDGIAKVAYVGSGFMMMSRACVQRISDAHPELRARITQPGRPDLETAMIFETTIEASTGRHLSEDYALCMRWRDLGGEIWADVESRFTHTGPAAYTGSLIQALGRRRPFEN
jgi:hypothetical protein